MLEQLLIFTRGGLVLWTCQELGNALRGSPIDALIRSCLLEERSASTAFHYDAPGASYTLKWSFSNDLGLVFVAVYQRMLHLLYIDELLAMVKREFTLIYDSKRTDYPAFDDTFRQLLREAEARASELRSFKPAAQAGIAKRGGLKSDRLHGKAGKQSGSRDIGGGDDDADGDGSRDAEQQDNGKGMKTTAVSAKQFNGKIHHVEASSTPSSSDEDSGVKKNTTAGIAFDVNKLQKLKARGKKGATPGAAASKGSKEEAGKKKKQNRVWQEGGHNSKLDFTDPVDESREIETSAAGVEGKSLMDTEDVDYYDTEQEEEEQNKGKPVSGKKGWFSSLMESVSGKSVIDEKDLEPKLKTLKDRLMMKNVAEEIAEDLCSSVGASLVGKKLGSFTRVSSTVQTAMEEALVRILTPKRSVDILRDVHAAKEQGRPYIIVFVGVNGVGKSTNLAKVAYWLLQHDISVMMAACDTFRSGAVEQLRTHARRLKIPVFEQGYERDPAMVAREAIKEAYNKTDVVLVDTAGRMQDNEPLMRALSKLVNKNNPDLVLFVGEALVGNDGVDQLMKFNQKLSDLSTSATPRVIDGILLTKFDTVDDKVGAALSMVYKSGAPIMFVGCGQTYTDLKKLNVKSLIKSMLK